MKEKDKRRDVRGESRERAKCQRETLGKYFYDLSKLTFTALVLGGIAMLFQSKIFAQRLTLALRPFTGLTSHVSPLVFLFHTVNFSCQSNFDKANIRLFFLTNKHSPP